MPKVSAVVLDDKSEERSVEVEYDALDDCGQTKAYILIPDANQEDGSYLYTATVKVDNVDSENGINNGRISKLRVRDVNTNDDVIEYDCGWHRTPSCFAENVVVSILLRTFDTPTWEQAARRMRLSN